MSARTESSSALQSSLSQLTWCASLQATDRHTHTEREREREREANSETGVWWNYDRRLPPTPWPREIKTAAAAWPLWKVAGSNPCWNGGRIFFSRVDFLCWLLFRYPFHPRVTTVARKKSRSFCQKCRWQVTAKHAYTLRMRILLNRASALVTTCP